MNTKITGAVILVCQWIQAAAAARQGDILCALFASYGAPLPFPANIAGWLFHLPVLMSVTLVLSAGLVSSELFVKSERTRLRIQIGYFAVWTTVVMLLMASMVMSLHTIPAQG
jgi:hypothetical protein